MPQCVRSVCSTLSIYSPGFVQVIVKKPTAIAKLWREVVQLMYSCRSPYLVEFVGICPADDKTVWIVTREAKHGSLDKLLFYAENPTYGMAMRNALHTRACVLSIARDVAAGLRYLHGRRVVHGDLAARNVLLDEFGMARLTDFGHARELPTLAKGGKLEFKMASNCAFASFLVCSGWRHSFPVLTVVLRRPRKSSSKSPLQVMCSCSGC